MWHYLLLADALPTNPPESHFWDGFGGALSGGLLALIGSFGAIYFQLKAERGRRKEEEAANKDRILASIYHEVDAFWTDYMKRTGHAIEKEAEGTVFHYIVSLPENVFAIYDSEARFIGTIPDYSLRNKIITTYLNLKTLRESYALHNRYASEATASNQENDAHRTPETAKLAQVKLMMLQKSARGLRQGHVITKQAVEELLKIMRPFADPIQTID